MYYFFSSAWIQVFLYAEFQISYLFLRLYLTDNIFKTDSDIALRMNLFKYVLSQLSLVCVDMEIIWITNFSIFVEIIHYKHCVET